MYGLCNASAKWQAFSDDLLLQLGLQRIALIPQLFVWFLSGCTLSALVAKDVDDTLIGGPIKGADDIVRSFNAKLHLVTVTRGPSVQR